MDIFPVPLLVDDNPSDKKFLKYFISPKIKPNRKYICKFHPYHCANVINQIHGSNFTESFVPVIGAFLV